MPPRPLPELQEWAEYYCPFCYVAALRLDEVLPEYAGRLAVRTRAFPLELVNGEGPPRDILEQEWWIAALQAPEGAFAPYPGDDWPVTTLPAFDAAWAAAQQGAAIGHDFDLRIRRAFFAQGRNIGRPEVLRELAAEAAAATGLDLARFERDVASPAARAAVLADSREARERWHVRGTPTLLRADGSRLALPIAYPKIRARKVVAVAPLPCAGAGCADAMRALLDRALQTPAAGAASPPGPPPAPPTMAEP